ncbi:YaaR family protein [Christensenella intestinihominis]|uniref:YaaR family protein n=1 Tax=Christensenella intestinihominis TaxID=1851429 RepID=UPI000833101E|nr:YaaR family protein [Christensenella intestinihominis]
MKVQNINNIPMESMSRADIESVSPQGTELTFSSKLTEESNSVYIRHIEELIGQIEKQGRRLSERADMGEMQKYREMITKLLNETVSNGFAFHKEGKIGVNGRSKIFAMISKVNEKLDAMTKSVLEEEKDNINLLDDIDDIRGLLVDMYL